MPVSGAVETRIEPGRVNDIDGQRMSRSPSEIAAGATTPPNGQRMGVMKVQSMRLVERQYPSASVWKR